MGLVGLVIQPLWAAYKFFSTPGRMNKVKKERMIASGLVVAALVGFVLFVPLPFSVQCNFEVQAHDAAQVFANVQGQLVRIEKKPGDFVKAGDVIMQLENQQLRYELAGAKGQLSSDGRLPFACRRTAFA